MVFAGTSHGHFFIHWPQNFHLGAEIDAQVLNYWTPAPPYRVVLLFGGLELIMLWNVAAAWLARSGAGPVRALSAPGRRRRLAARPRRV